MNKRNNRRHGMIKSILLPIDGSKYSESVLDYGKFFAKKLDAFLRIISVIDIRLFDWSMATGADSFVPVMPTSEFQEESQKIQDEKAQKTIDKAASVLKNSEVKYELLKVSGIPVDEICQHAMKTDLVIMGIHGEYERWSQKLLGSTIEAVTRQISKPVLLVDKEFVEISRLHCGYDGSPSSNRALQMASELANILQMKLEVITVCDSGEERKMLLNEASDYLDPYGIEYNLRHETGDAADVLINACKDAPEPPMTIIGSYGHSRLREAIIGSTTVDVMRNATKPVLLAK
ncbi:MAG: hypothetical protein GF313_08325 [Caldithrix sp.]|nr:hypothetical protein [Caldithrix sp.]